MKQPHHLRMILYNRPHERGLPANTLLCIDRSSVFEEDFHGFHAAGSRGGHQDGLSIGVRGVRIRAGTNQFFDHAGIRIQAC